MKSLKIFKLAIFAFACLVIASSCVKEGPMGPAGADGANGADGTNGTDGTDGVDGHVTCLVCHSAANKADNTWEYNRSQHASGDISLDYAGGRSSCARCHSGNGFMEFASTGTVSANITPERIDCATCHSLHTTFGEEDYALRLSDPVTVLGTEVDLGSANLCVNCHQPRRGWDDYDDESGELVMVTSSHAGPHHGTQSSVLMGIGGDYRIAPEAGAMGPSTHGTTAKCTGCHMYESTEESEGGHTWWPSVEACQTCHTSATDFDYVSIQTTIEAKLTELGHLLEAVEGNKIERDANRVWQVVEGEKVHGIVHQDEEGAWHPVVGQFTRTQFSAFWNFMNIIEDRSKGVHNPAYAKKLLDESITALQ